MELLGVEMFDSHTQAEYSTGRIGVTNRDFFTGECFSGIAKLSYQRIKIA